MFKFILKRIALMFPLMIVVSFMTFLLTYITNENPAVTILHAQGTPNVTPELIAETNEKYGFNDPLLIQYKIGYLKRCNLILVQATLQVTQLLNVLVQHL